MALNIKSLIPTLEHPPVTCPERPTQTEQGAAEQEHAFDPKDGARERALLAWHEHQEKTKKLKKIIKKDSSIYLSICMDVVLKSLYIFTYYLAKR